MSKLRVEIQQAPSRLFPGEFICNPSAAARAHGGQLTVGTLEGLGQSRGEVAPRYALACTMWSQSPPWRGIGGQHRHAGRQGLRRQPGRNSSNATQQEQRCHRVGRRKRHAVKHPCAIRPTRGRDPAIDFRHGIFLGHADNQQQPVSARSGQPKVAAGSVAGNTQPVSSGSTRSRWHPPPGRKRGRAGRGAWLHSPPGPRFQKLRRQGEDVRHQIARRHFRLVGEGQKRTLPRMLQLRA